MSDSRAPDAVNDAVTLRVLVPDGGELVEAEEGEGEAEAQEGDAAQETEEGQEAEDAEESQEADEAGEGEEADEAEADEEAEEAEADEAEAEAPTEAGPEARHEDERAAAETDEGARLLHLNVDGLFLDLLGLEVDLDEVTLDLTARTGEGKLLGNLLAAVSDLLGGDGLGSLLGGGDGDSLLGLPSMPSLPDLNPIERARELAGRIADRLRQLVGQAILALPLEELLSQFLEGLVDQLLDTGNGAAAEEEEEEEAAASA